MKIKYALLTAIFSIFIAYSGYSQRLWNRIEPSQFQKNKNEVYQKDNFPLDFKMMSLNIDAFKNSTNIKSKTATQIIELPNSEGVMNRFFITEDSNFEPELQKQFPAIQSFSAQGIDDKTAVAKISLGSDGFHGVIFSGNQETVYIDPYTKDNKSYLVYKRSSLSDEDESFKCLVTETKSKKAFSNPQFERTPNDGKLRTYRLAIVTSGEYSDFHLGPDQQNVPSTTPDGLKKFAILSAVNTSLTRINGVFERELSIKLLLVNNNSQVIFLDKDTDGITDGNPDTMINEVQQICDNVIGNANYDIGHVFSIGGDGLAGLGVICRFGQKARGVTGRFSPVGDAYDIDFVAHEMGHQLGANHTQNNNCNRNNTTAVEPGSASTIMGYAGICSPNVQGQSDDYFHAISIAEIWDILTTTGNCGVFTNTNNAAPTANAGLDFSIPVSTPFKLTGTATDANNPESLTYNWEQIDNETGSMPPAATNTVGPMFRSLPSKTTPIRYFPDISTVIAGDGATGSTWERISSVARELNFSFTVRDNFSGGAGMARDDMKITVVNSIPFAVTSQNSTVSYDTGSTQIINWEKGSTDIAPINCQNVTIKLSTDGGLTFPIVLKSNTPNDGTETVIIPNNPTTSARILVEAVDNIFYNMNSTNFTINSTTPTFIITQTNGNQEACNIGNQSANFEFSVDFVNGFSENVIFSATGQPTGSLVSFTPPNLATNGNVTMTISNLNGVTTNDYVISVLASSVSINQNIDVLLKITSNNFNVISLTTPQNNATEIPLSQELKWIAEANARSYDVQIASDINFSNIVSSGNVASTSYLSNNLFGNTKYYWRVKPKNSCGEGPYSNAFSFTTIEPSYCNSTFMDEAGGGEHILNVTFNTINNNSGNDIEDGYENFTAISTNVKRGDNHQISVTLDTDGFQDHVFVFIDWNQDFVFDKTNERYDLGTEFADIGTKTFSISIPNEARFGETRMRVIIEYDDPSDNYGDGACDTDHKWEWGETEDYTIVVDATASLNDVSFSNFNLFPNPTKGAFQVQFDAENSKIIQIGLYDITGRFIAKKTYENSGIYFSKNVQFENVSTGLYLIKIQNGSKQTTRKLMIE